MGRPIPRLADGDDDAEMVQLADEPPGDDGETQTGRLLRLAGEAGLWHDADGDGWATLRVGSHHEHHRLRGRDFRRWLTARYYSECGGAPRSQAITDSLAALDARARFGGPAHETHVRVAEHEGVVYLDLGGPEWDAIAIDAHGWRIVSASPIRFRRGRGMRPLSPPASGGTLDELRQFVRVPAATWPLVLAWLVAAMRARGPYPVLALLGEQGSCKSTTARILRALVDPSEPDLRAEPREVRDVMIAASGAWVVGLDNLSRIEPWLSDCLCRLATGGGFGTRQLYSDDDEKLFTATRPIVVTAIEDVLARGDLLDRALIVRLDPVPGAERRTERDLWTAFESARPRLLGAALDAVVAGLAAEPTVRLAELPRMADFARWAAACEVGLGLAAGAVAEALRMNRADGRGLALEASPVSGPLVAWAGALPPGGWEGPAGDILRDVAKLVDETTSRGPGWPRTAKGMADTLRRLAPDLRAVEGLDLRMVGPRRWRVRRGEPEA